MRPRLLAAGSSLALFALSSSASAASYKYALAMAHFNVQYVAGGTVGFWPVPNPDSDKSAEYVEDRIVTESFEPVLDLFLAHPTWGTDLELQGYMLDVIGERHPGVLAKVKTLAAAGKVEFVSFHYSDQFFLAHAREDWQRSAELTKGTFAKWGIPLATSVFCQEGQAGPGMAAAMKDEGYATLVWPKNLFSFQQGGGVTPAPLYRFGDVQMITSREVTWSNGSDSIDTTWWFVDDGEKMMTGDLDPYFIADFERTQTSYDEVEQQLLGLEQQGFVIASVGDYVKAIANVVTPIDPPPLLDGTWQPGSTDGSYTWLGKAGLHGPDERDDEVQSLATIAHRELVAAATIAHTAGIDVSAELDAAWRLLALGEVSDAVGINPFRGEVEYGIAHLAEATRIAREVIDRAKGQMGAPSVVIDAQAGTAGSGDGPAELPAAEDAPVQPVVEGGDRAIDVTWTKAGPAEWVLDVRFGAGTARQVSVRFPGTMGDIVYTPALADAPVHAPRSAFAFDHFDLALSDGLIGLGGGLFVVEDEGRGHVGARIGPTDGDVTFHSACEWPDEETTWRFHVVQGDDAAAAAVAKGLNVMPKVWR